ncbi:hypothetical protein HDIA_4459 [Hartmannibacter diazotrophicus]|uniref:Polysaccharide biosynthesis protein n=1 Tax=Hartmannibacter diazotrophicus TaxID=1482074 RepID=A0A2C9DCV0_9HYPH|nr:O-unit flippase-like protein [Hartmannibacter diazotrophicus]SON58000.1 hypothetical protein HDIA_4459 [Hartmannibacter diazotrophicus]
MTKHVAVELLPLEVFRRSRRRGGHDLIFGIASQILQMGSGLIILPIVIATLAPHEVGFWYVFMTIQSMVYLLDFGFVPTISRNFNYIFAGADVIHSDRLPTQTKQGLVNLSLLQGLLTSSRNVYRLMALAVGLGLGTIGSLYINKLVQDSPPIANIWLDWGFFGAALVFHTYYQWQISVLTGADRIRETYEVAIVSRGFQVVVSIIGLAIVPSVTTLVVAYVLSALVMRLHLYFCMRDILRRVKTVPHLNFAAQLDLFMTLWTNTWRQGVVLMSFFLIGRFNVLVIAAYLGVVASGQFSIAAQALLAITGVAHVLANNAYPKIVNAKVHADFQRVKKLLSAGAVFMWTAYICGAICLIALGPFLISLLKDSTALPTTQVLLLMAFAGFVESNLQLFCHVITADNKVPFLWAYIISGTLITAGNILAGQFGMPLEAFVLIQICVQLCYNAWRWPLMALHDSHLRLHEIPRLSVRGLRSLLSSS